MTCGVARRTRTGDLYASAVGTTVLQLKEIPPQEHPGVLCLFRVVQDNVEKTLRAKLEKHGKITRIDLTLREHHGIVCVYFATREGALAAKCAGALAGVFEGIDMWYNERPYDDRGWCARPRPFAPRRPPSFYAPPPPFTNAPWLLR